MVAENADYVFEVSWEVCNKVGGIYTVLSTKALSYSKVYGNKHIVVGPDIWREDFPNPDFMEDEALFKAWKEELKTKNIRVKTGFWNIPGKPVAILVDFSTFINQKDQIFADFWERYQLDSISGQWDYIESALFGYATAKVIHEFCLFHLHKGEKIVANFHEWMTGAGVLYTKAYAPNIATVFTTHATAIGRSIAGNHLPLYSQLESYNGDAKARELNIRARHSLEKKAAWHADCFTTVSDITAKECEELLDTKVDVVLPNGFEADFVPGDDVFEKKRQKARGKLTQVAEALLGYSLEKDVLFVANSGRYEFKNKGIDVFIDAIKKLNDQGELKKQMVIFVLIPANTYGPRKDLQAVLQGEAQTTVEENKYLTHGLHDLQYDPILNMIKDSSVDNGMEDQIKLIFVPAYLKGNDGIFNMDYYSLLIGMDLTVFPSYYEPWGYTPLESIAFKIPTITTSLAGFGLWMQEASHELSDGVKVIARDDHNYQEVVESLYNVMRDFSKWDEKTILKARSNASRLSEMALWKNLVKNYYAAYKLALDKKDTTQEIKEKTKRTEKMNLQTYNTNQPQWRDISIVSKLPSKLNGLGEIANNFWYVWNYEAGELFASIDRKLWEMVNNNPVRLLESTSNQRFEELMGDADFMKAYKAVYDKFKKYMAFKPSADAPSIAYFSMEYGLTDILKIYSGGLGILAGDYLKEASDCGVNMSAVGLLYRYGYFTQALSIHGDQQAVYEIQNFSMLPLTQAKDDKGQILKFSIPFPGRDVYVQVWIANVGRVPLYLLDTDLPENSDGDKYITHQLYGGDWENRLKQEIVLGFGGIKALRLLGVEKELFHCNEGHAAFTTLARLDRYINEEHLNFSEAYEVVRASSLFTTHTPVPAGHDSFDEGMLRTYLRHMPDKLQISWEDFMALGRFVSTNHGEKFSMSVLAAKLSQEMNGVSWLHGKVSQDMFKDLWKGYFAEELHVGYVTNGVHYGTWTSTEWRKVYEGNFGDKFMSDLSNPELWSKIKELPDALIWDTKLKLKKKLTSYIKERFEQDWLKKQGDPSRVVEVLDGIKPKALTIGFARRFATYKRAHLLFNDLDRLRRVLNNPDRPVQFLFAGKAHPADGGGQGLIKRIVEISKMAEFQGKIIFLENYDMKLARRLVSGVDIWLNTPTRPLEASGTSGQKAELNGTLNLSVLDGWWLEGYRNGAGWAVTDKRTYENQEHQDELDAATIYSILENEIIPTYYDKEEDGYSEKWVQFIKNSIAEIAPIYTTKRMLDDYLDRFYTKLYARSLKMKKSNYKFAVEMAGFKQKIAKHWDAIKLVNIIYPDFAAAVPTIGQKYEIKVQLDLGEIKPNEIGIELVQVRVKEDQSSELQRVRLFKHCPKDTSHSTFCLDLEFQQPGQFKYAIRMFPVHEGAPHRQDFLMLTWL